MSDDIERFENGEAGFAAFRIPGWHHLGEVFTEILDTPEVLTLANMGEWNVRLVPTVSMVDGKMLDVPDRFTVVRDHPIDKGRNTALGVVGKKYTVVQNEQVFGFADAILQAHPEAHWDTAGSIRDGRTIFGCLELPATVKIGGVDQVNLNLMVSSSHDGSSGIVAAVTPVRVVCANTLRLAMRQATHTFKARHTSSVDGRIADAQKALAISGDYFEVFVNNAERLADVSISDAQLDELIESVWPKPEYDENSDARRTGLTRWENKAEKVLDIWNGEADLSGLDTMSEIKGTGWGALNALSESVDWYGRDTGKFERASGFNIHAEDEKSRIGRKVMALALPEPTS